MKLKLKLTNDEVVAACKNLIEEKLLLHHPYSIECDNDYSARDLEFTVTIEKPNAEPA